MSIKQYTGYYCKDGVTTKVNDSISVEIPLAISINGIAYTVTMQTPGAEEDLALGLLFTEEIINEQSIKKISLKKYYSTDGNIEKIDIVADNNLVLKNFSGSRNIASVSSCGICGKTDVEFSPGCINKPEMFLKPEIIEEIFQTVNKSQSDFKISGGTHAAALFTLSGDMLCMREDIGRHNAVDKVIGHLLANENLKDANILSVSGRLSYEIISKASKAQIPFVASVSAPSSLAVDFAQKSGITLMAFCRNDHLTVYSNPQRMIKN